ncbi:unnamed protein product [Mytilus coruscus]|uniref:Uncharacterized protein n=1 Tax=Mytilus coruscus TaxID=42192 RepID=A0A6J8ES33_MYTCO|nr:unnamed protein product [Mytilus coruscus]
MVGHHNVYKCYLGYTCYYFVLKTLKNFCCSPWWKGGWPFCKGTNRCCPFGDNKTVKATDVIGSVETEVGEGTVLACVPKNGNAYEITLIDKEALDLVVDTGLKVGEANYKPYAIFSRDKVVSFFNVYHYVPDSEIRDKLLEFGAEVKSQIKNKMYPMVHVIVLFAFP